MEFDRPKPGRFLRGGSSLENPTDWKLATVRSRIEDREIGFVNLLGTIDSVIALPHSFLLKRLFRAFAVGIIAYAIAMFSLLGTVLLLSLR